MPRFLSFSLVCGSLALAGCMGAGDPPVAAQVPQPAVAASAQPVPGATTTPASTGAGVTTVAAAPGRPVAGPTRLEAEGMRTAPGARESQSLTNVSRVPTGAPTGGNALGGTIVSGQSAGVIPTTVDRNREPTRIRSTAPRDPLGPGTAPPVIAPELRDTTGRSIRNRQEVQF